MIPIVAQRRSFDCGVACVAMVCHVEYSDAFFVAAKIAGSKLREGLTVAQLARVAARLKRPMRKVHYRKVDLDEDAGILGVLWPGPAWKSGHWVVLRHGTIIDPERGEVWDADEFMRSKKGRPATLLVEK